MKKIILSKALERYRTQVSILKKGRSQEGYRLAQLSRSALGGKFVHEITSVDIAAYRDVRLLDINSKTQEQISPATVRLELALLSNFFDIAMKEWGYCRENPVLLVRKPKAPPGRQRRLSRREERQILRYCHSYSNNELLSIVVLALETAMRMGEILKLTWEDVNFKTRVAHLSNTKNGSDRDIPLSIRAREAITRLGVKPSGRIFNYSPSGLKSVWRVMMIALQIEDCHFHDLRHEATSRLFELGTLDMMEVASITGHKSLAMLKRYTHLRAQRLVKKLEGNKSRVQQSFAQVFQPYPAQRTIRNGIVRIKILDLDGLTFEGEASNAAEIEARAEDGLRKRLTILVCQGKKIPQPDEYMEAVPADQIWMVNPVPNEQLEGMDELLDTVLS